MENQNNYNRDKPEYNSRGGGDYQSRDDHRGGGY
jgi:hypothetical protein